MLKGAKILTAQYQRGNLCIWALVDADETATEVRNFMIYGTGMTLPDNPGVYIDTVQEVDLFVWHIFEGVGNE